MKFVITIIFIAISLFAQNESFNKSKKELRKVYHDHQTTIYCDCKYNYKDKKNMIDKESCGYIPRNKFTYKEIIKRDNTNLDIFWLKDDSVEDSADLPEPKVLIEDILENLEYVKSEFEEIYEELGR